MKIVCKHPACKYFFVVPEGKHNQYCIVCNQPLMLKGSCLIPNNPLPYDFSRHHTHDFAHPACVPKALRQYYLRALHQ